MKDFQQIRFVFQKTSFHKMDSGCVGSSPPRQRASESKRAPLAVRFLFDTSEELPYRHYITPTTPTQPISPFSPLQLPHPTTNLRPPPGFPVRPPPSSLRLIVCVLTAPCHSRADLWAVRKRLSPLAVQITHTQSGAHMQALAAQTCCSSSKITCADAEKQTCSSHVAFTGLQRT